jgi:hypothetical protein
MGIAVDPNAQPTVSALNSDGTVQGWEVQESGISFASFFNVVKQQWFSPQRWTLGGAALGFVVGGFPGAVLGAYFAPTVLNGMINSVQDAIDDHLNDRSLRQAGEILRGSNGYSALGSPYPYTGPDPNLMVPNSTGNRLTFHAKIRPVVPKIVKKLSMTTRDRNTIGLFMMTIKTTRVDETIKGLARARVIHQAQSSWSETQRQNCYNNEIPLLNNLMGTERGRTRQLCNIQTYHSKAGKKPIDYSRTTVKYSVDGVLRTERGVAASGVVRLCQKAALTGAEKVVLGRWARANIASSSATDTWCRDLAKRNGTYETHMRNQIALAKAS